MPKNEETRIEIAMEVHMWHMFLSVIYVGAIYHLQCIKCLGV